jgi:PAS domain S-box-containing protein
MSTGHTEQRLRAVVETAVDGVILIDARGTVLMFNPACERLFGYKADEVIGRNVKMLMPEPHRFQHDTFLDNYHTTGERKIIGIGREVVGKRKDASVFPMDLSVGESKEGEHPIYVGVIRDLTERKEAEKALRDSAARLTALVNTAVDGVILIDATGTVLMFNPACERLFGYHAEEVMGQNVKMLMPAPYRDEHDGYLGNYHRTGERKIIGIGREVVGQKKDGTTFPMDLSVGQAKQDNQSLFVGLIHDLTERKRTEEQLVQAQKMEAVGQLSGGIAHDFNNLLTVIMGNAEALSIRLKARDDLQSLADGIVNAAERGAELTQRLLAFSRRQMLRPDAIDCGLLVEEMQRLLRRTLREDVDLKIHLPAHPMLALADRAQLESAILNLALNAQDAMPEGGVLTLTITEEELEQGIFGPDADVRPGLYVAISVTDDGTGMTPEVRERVFEPFFTTKEVGKGSGLGLSMVYGFVRQSNGHVTIYSEEGLGTTVRIFLPIADPSMRRAVQAIQTRPIPRGEEIVLIVEDDAYVREHAINSLEGLGYRIMVASDGREALAILQAGARPAMLFTDIVMPGGMSGWDLVRAARELLPALKVLYTSGYPLETLTNRGLLGGSERLLNKPYRVADLARRVRETLDE